jgi:hypothetical protein
MSQIDLAPRPYFAAMSSNALDDLAQLGRIYERAESPDRKIGRWLNSAGRRRRIARSRTRRSAILRNIGPCGRGVHDSIGSVVPSTTRVKALKMAVCTSVSRSDHRLANRRPSERQRKPQLPSRCHVLRLRFRPFPQHRPVRVRQHHPNRDLPPWVDRPPRPYRPRPVLDLHVGLERLPLQPLPPCSPRSAAASGRTCSACAARLRSWSGPAPRERPTVPVPGEPPDGRWRIPPQGLPPKRERRSRRLRREGRRGNHRRERDAGTRPQASRNPVEPARGSHPRGRSGILPRDEVPSPAR